MQSQIRLNRVLEKVPEKVWEALVQSQVQQGSGEGSGEGSRKPWCKAKSGSTGFWIRFRRRFRRRSGRLWCRARSGSTGFRRRFRPRSGRLWCRARSGSTGLCTKASPTFSGTFSGTLSRTLLNLTWFRRRFWRRSGRLWRTLRCFQSLASQHASERSIKIKRCGCWGYHRSLFPTSLNTFSTVSFLGVICIHISPYFPLFPFAKYPQENFRLVNLIVE